MSNVHEDCEYAANAPLIDGYVAKFRAHPLIKPVYMDTNACLKHCERTRGWTPDVKCQLTTSYLAESFAKTAAAQ